jgi:hypothetical protein
MNSLEYTRHVDRYKVAEVLGIKPQVVNELRLAGKIPFLRLSKRSFRYDLAAVLESIRAQSEDE